jgi:hypothetical protein
MRRVPLSDDQSWVLGGQARDLAAATGSMGFAIALAVLIGFYDQLLAMMYTRGKAVSVAAQMEIDAVVDPAETRQWLTRGVRSAGPRTRRAQPIVDVW